MAKRQFIPALLAAFGLVLVAAALAELPREPEDSATYILTGKVSKVFTRDGGASMEYAVQIQIEDLHKGDVYKTGDFVYAYVFQQKPGAQTERPGAAGHRAVPEEGARIRAWLRSRRGVIWGLYPDWFEVLKAPVTDEATAVTSARN
jgi:hypothetical protein